MQLVYQVNDNFGDRLNEWLWDRAAPGLMDKDPSTLVLGLGTIMNEWFVRKLDPGATKIAIGCGAGDKGLLPDISSGWRVYGVRGPLTASYFGLGPEAVIGDPAILLSRFTDLVSTGPRQGVGFMPHCRSLDEWDWETTCREAGLVYVDPRGDPHDTIQQISGLERLLSEAMHGAVVADAVRTPWSAVRISSYFWASKWSDWAGALGLHVLFHTVTQLRDLRRKRTSYRLKQAVKRGLAPFGVDRHVDPPRSKAYEVNQARRQLQRIAAEVDPQLSSDAACEAATCRIEAALDRLVRDKQAGMFHA